MAGGDFKGVQVRGLKELIRAFRIMPAEIVEEFVWELEEAANPVRLAAQQKAAPVLTWTLGTTAQDVYTAMRVGVSKPLVTVWVVPDLRGGHAHLSPRAKATFIERVQERALEPALEENTSEVIRKIDDMLDRIATSHGF